MKRIISEYVEWIMLILLMPKKYPYPLIVTTRSD